MQFETWLFFLLTSVGMSLVPGPNGLLVLSHGAIHGSQKTVFTILGGLLGLAIVMGLSMFGVGAIVKSSVFWFTVLKWVGGAYLVWLGIKLWLSPPITIESDGAAVAAKGRTLFRQGFFTAATNPKALFFLSALLPQFIDPQRSLVVQFMVIALTHMFTEFVVEYAFAYTAHSVRPWIARTGKRFNQVCGGIFAAIGVALPLRA